MFQSRLAKQFLRIFILILIVDLIQAICIGVVWYISDTHARLTVSERLDIVPNWQILSEYIQKQFSVGMSRTDILMQAQRIGRVNMSYYFIGNMYCEVFSFRVGPFDAERGGRWRICYNDSNIAIKVEQALRQ
jgi:hypothetical protein